MARHRVTIGIGDEHYEWLSKLAGVSGQRVGDVARDMVIQILDGMQDMFKDIEGQTSESAKRKILRTGLNKMIDAMDDDDEKKR
jgi:hypothetical protein